MNIRLTKDQKEELMNLNYGDCLDLKIKGIWAFITRVDSNDYANIEYKGHYFELNYYAPSEMIEII